MSRLNPKYRHCCTICGAQFKHQQPNATSCSPKCRREYRHDFEKLRRQRPGELEKARLRNRRYFERHCRAVVKLCKQCGEKNRSKLELCRKCRHPKKIRFCLFCNAELSGKRRMLCGKDTCSKAYNHNYHKTHYDEEQKARCKASNAALRIKLMAARDAARELNIIPPLPPRPSKPKNRPKRRTARRIAKEKRNAKRRHNRNYQILRAFREMNLI